LQDILKYVCFLLNIAADFREIAQINHVEIGIAHNKLPVVFPVRTFSLVPTSA
jgi:L-lysine 2,3-aminomutase